MFSFRSTAAPMPPAGAPGRRQRRVILVICSLSLFMTYVDSTILNVALPTIARQFHVGVADLQWVADAYLLVLSSFIMLIGSLADRIGRRRIFMTGLLLFSAGSLLCSLAPSVQFLIVFRMLQAIGGCMLTPVSLSIIRQVFTDPVERARALGIWSAVFGTGIATGPILGGLLVSGIGWRSVFWVNVPVGIGAWLLARAYVPESRAPRARRVDPGGQLLVILLLSSTTFAVIDGASLSWGSAPIVAAFSLGAVALVLLIVLERSRIEPLIELHFFSSPTFSVAIGAAIASFLALSGFLFVNTLYLQEVRGDSALTAGLSLLPATVAIAVAALVSGRLVARYGPRMPMVLAGLGIAIGAALLLDLKQSTPYALLILSYLLLGLGFGLINPPITNTAVTGMPPEQAGVASATVSTSRQVGSVLGVAVMGSLVTGADLGNGRLLRSDAVAFTTSTHLAWMLVIACGVACALAASLFTGPRGLRAAARVYEDSPAASSAALR
jgi:EmrB/QacA subfamily drug resistance transporter